VRGRIEPHAHVDGPSSVRTKYAYEVPGDAYIKLLILIALFDWAVLLEKKFGLSATSCFTTSIVTSRR